MKQQKEHLLNDWIDQVIGAVRVWFPSTQEGHEVRRKALAYLRVHAHRMRYRSLRAAGWHIGSGVVEAMCKGVIQGRMKGAGMRWGEEGAEAMLHLRTAWCSSGYTDFADVARRSLPSS